MRYLMLLKADQPADPAPAGADGGDHEARRGGHRGRRAARHRGPGPERRRRPVSLTGGELSVTDGPFAEAKEIISYALYEVRSKEEAVEWASRFLKLHRDLWAGLGGRGRRAEGLRTGGLRAARLDHAPA